MNDRGKINKVLVILSPDLIQPDKPMESVLLNRAVSLARKTGCALELFHVCYDNKLDNSLFASDDDLHRERKHLADRDATRVAEIAARLNGEWPDTTIDVRWDNPRPDAILRKIAESSPDIVMKQAKEHSFVLGITSNTDWELVRRSPAPIWLVDESVADIDRIVAAVGNRFGDPSDITTAADYDLRRAAGTVGSAFSADIYPVNAYQLPPAPAFVVGAAGAAVVPPDHQDETHTKLVKQHRGAVKALANYFDISRDNVHVCEGHPAEVIPDVSEAVDADMIIMGARSIGRMERLTTSVTVEPVMSATNCDVLIVGETDWSRVPDIEARSLSGKPNLDLESAITNPEDAFESPGQVANTSEISIELRQRILQVWEYDIRAEMANENEGGAVGDIEVNALDDILSAQALLEMKREQRGDEPPMLSGASG